MPPSRTKPSKRSLPGGLINIGIQSSGTRNTSFPPSTLASGANSEDGTPQPSQTLADRLSYFSTTMPFKNPTYLSSGGVGGVGKNRNKKSVKQILVMERERAGGDASNSSNNNSNGGTAGVGGSGGRRRNESRKTSPVRGRKGKGVETDQTMEVGDEDGVEKDGKRKLDDIITYLTPTAPPSLFPPKKYCDITGLPAMYTDPKTRLHYRGLEVWGVIRSLGPGYDQAYLTLRRANNALV